jgi:hypothetical protein
MKKRLLDFTYLFMNGDYNFSYKVAIVGPFSISDTDYNEYTIHTDYNEYTYTYKTHSNLSIDFNVELLN